MKATNVNSARQLKKAINDLLTIRADRIDTTTTCTTYSAATLTSQDVVRRCLYGWSLLALVRYSQRRVNYFLKHLLVDSGGKLRKTSRGMSCRRIPQSYVTRRDAFRHCVVGRCGQIVHDEDTVVIIHFVRVRYQSTGPCTPKRRQ
jgi:hypothetical protein